MPYFAYVLKSLSTGKHYYGNTSDLKKRLESHNSTQNRSTRGKGPWILIAYIEFNNKYDAILTEKKFKSYKNPSRVLNRIQKNGGVIRKQQHFISEHHQFSSILISTEGLSIGFRIIPLSIRRCACDISVIENRPQIDMTKIRVSIGRYIQAVMFQKRFIRYLKNNKPSRHCNPHC